MFLPVSFGTGADGAFSASTTVTLTSGGGLVVKQYSSFNLASSGVLTVDAICRGLVIFCLGDIVVNGIIRMDGMAGSVAGPAALLARRPVPGPGSIAANSDALDLYGFLGHAAGGADGEYSGRGGGGGWGGHASTSNGARVYSGVSSSGGQVGGLGESINGPNGLVPGGAGGAGGGVLLLVARGNITIGSAGLLSAAGGNGGNGGDNAAAGGGGGGGGGGVIAALYLGTYTNNHAAATGSSALSCPGGTGGAGGVQGGGGATAGSTGGHGSFLNHQIAMV